MRSLGFGWLCLVIACGGDPGEPTTNDLRCSGDTWDHDGDPTTACVAWTTCSAGQFVATEGSATADRTCAACAPGTYSASENQASCQPYGACAAGTEQTAAGTFTSPPVCEACESGTYCAGGDAAAEPCAGETWDDDVDAATVCVAWSDCAAGTHVVADGSATTDRACTECETGTYSSEENQTTCTTYSACAAGTAQTAAATPSSPPACEACDSGTYCAGGEAAAAPCAGETWDDDGDPATACVAWTPCAAGTVQTAAATPTSPPVCDTCEPGTYCPGGSASAAPCTDSFDHDSDPGTACAPWATCAAGTHVDDAGTATTNRTCADCDAGTYSSDENQLTCTPHGTCAAGTEKTAEGTDIAAPVCEPCSAGTYCAGGDAPAEPCVNGWDDDEDPATACVPWSVCLPGQKMAADGSATADRDCDACPDGTFSAAVNSASCVTWTTCPTGQHAYLAGSATHDRACDRNFNTFGVVGDGLALRPEGGELWVTGWILGEDPSGPMAQGISVIDLETLEVTHQIPFSATYPMVTNGTNLAFAPAGLNLLFATAEDHVAVFDTTTYELVHTFDEDDFFNAPYPHWDGTTTTGYYSPVPFSPFSVARAPDGYIWVTDSSLKLAYVNNAWQFGYAPLARIDPTDFSIELTVAPSNGNNSGIQVSFGQLGGYFTSTYYSPFNGLYISDGLIQFCISSDCGPDWEGFDPFPGLASFAPGASYTLGNFAVHANAATGTDDVYLVGIVEYPDYTFEQNIYRGTFAPGSNSAELSGTYPRQEGQIGGLAVSPDGRFLYSTVFGTQPEHSNRLQVVDVTGELGTRYAEVPYLHPHAMTVASDGTIYASDSSDRKLSFFWPAAFTSGELSQAVPGVAYADQVRATGNPRPTFTLTSGSLPDGLSLQSDGTITGTPTAGATSSTFTVTITNNIAVPVSKQVTLEVF